MVKILSSIPSVAKPPHEMFSYLDIRAIAADVADGMIRDAMAERLPAAGPAAVAAPPAAAVPQPTWGELAGLKAEIDQTRRELADVATLAAARPAPAEAPAAGAAGLDVEGVKELIRAAFKTFRPRGGNVVTVQPPPPAAEVEVGLCHKVFAEVLELAAARENIFLVGPTGPGKTHLAAQVAKALGLRYRFLSCTAGMSEGQIAGRLLPTGEGGRFEYVISEFVRCYEEGGVFLMDEVDAADSNTLLLINAAIDNGEMALPNRPAKPIATRHPDFVLICAANTMGNGADRSFVGRNQLDAAFLDRFAAGRLVMDYDEELEAALTPNYAEVRVTLQEYRRRAGRAKLRRFISTRFILKCAKLQWDLARVEKALFIDWSADEIAKVKGGAA